MNLAVLQEWVDRISGAIWGPVTVTVMLTIGAVLTVQNAFLQFRCIRLWLHATIGQVLRPRHANGTISRTQALATALAGTMGTGNIVGVAAALTMGGAGAVFWMWASAVFGMMIKYGETVLAVHFRRRERDGWVGGTMEILETGLHRPRLALVFAVGCVLASFGMGNMAQANAISQAMLDAFGLSPIWCGIGCAALTGAVICGGLKRIATVAEKLIPALSFVYGLGGIFVIVRHANQLLPALIGIFGGAFTLRSAAGGIAGAGIAAAMRYGFSNGIFSNEAGLGSSSMVYAAADDAKPVEQGFWAIFEVFADTFVVCTITALAILTSGVSLTAQTGAALAIAAFETCFGAFGGRFIAISIALFAFASMIGWAYYGERGYVKMSGGGWWLYRVLFVLAAYVGSVAQLELVWGISEIFNGWMAVPNLLALILLAPVIRAETNAYFAAPEHRALPQPALKPSVRP